MLVSIIIPVYKSEKYIEKCIRSVLDQTFENLEIIIVDDCGKDASIDIVKRILVEYPHIAYKVRFIYNEFNMGSAAARREGMKIATGDYILQIDSDDYVESTMVERLAEKAKQDDADMVVCNICKIFSTKRVVVKNYPPKDNLDFVSKILTGEIHAGVSNKLIRRKIVADHNIYPVPGINMGDDMTILLESLMFMNKISFIDETLYYYNRTVEGSLSKSVYPMINDIKIINLFKEFFERNEIQLPQVLESFDKFKIGRLGRNLFYSDLDDVKKNLDVFTFDKKQILRHKNLPIHYKLIVLFYLNNFMCGVKFLRALKKLKG